MTEAEWLDGWYYPRMYDMVENRATTRQTRLYMVACCRLMAAQFFDPRILHALQTAERCADDPQAEAVANAVWNELVTSPRPQLPRTGPEGEVARAITGAWQLLDEVWGGEHYRNARHAISHAVYLCLRDRPREVFTGGEGNAAEYCSRAIDSAESLLLGVKPDEVEQVGLVTKTEIRKAIANLLRDIFGNPFRPVTADPSWLAWNSGTILHLAQGIYGDRRFDDLPILADALEEAGCTNADILTHCRQPGEHVLGCWVLDNLLRKV
jgi:hypothetical protein